jgi:replicative DNA helicase Mcm
MNNDKINLSISKDDEEKIKKLSHDELLIDKMVASCAPDIYGYEDIKLAILLQLFGGVRKMEEDGKLKRRGDFHILIIGDPGAGKSKLLKGAMKIAPKSQYSTGPSSSGKGMTAIVSRDELTGGWYVEAGALVLANNGLHIQDEVDKTGKDDMHYLHEALEEQTISIHKGGIHTQLITHTSLLAGGNPKHSRFSNFETVAEQINLEPSFISRFDLIFTIKDKPDKTRDDLIINRILDVHLNIDTIRPEIDSLLLKKYITYAREHYKPIISSVAREKVREIYHILRGYNKGDSKTIAITTRIGEGLIRISEAAAKMRLSDIIEKRDVELAEKIIMASLKDIALDPETGKLDIDRIDTNMSSSKRNDMYTILNLLKNSKEPILIEDIIEHCAQKGMNDLEVERMVEKLNFTGEIVEHVRGKGYVIMK